MMKTFNLLISRNIKLFFKDKGLFFTSLITPLILLLLYVTFLGNQYEQTFVSNLSTYANLPSKLINGLVGSQLMSSILSVSCITVSFCTNFLISQDKVNGTLKDIMITPVKKSTVALAYYLSSFISSLIICLSAALICLCYISFVAWYYSILDIVMIILDVFILVSFGTALSSVINTFLKSQGQISAVGTIVSSGYGFICGAYMPISTFSPSLQKILSFLPSTYGTSLIRNHTMNAAVDELSNYGIPEASINALKDAFDINIYFNNRLVTTIIMISIILISNILLIGIYILLNKRKAKSY